MIELIDRLFKHHSFAQQNLNFGELYSSAEFGYYWLVVEVDDITDVLIKQNEWFEACSNIVKTKDFHKNTSLLIIVEEKDKPVLKSELFKIEEDPFQFKKYVLPYSKKAFNELEENTENGEPKAFLKLLYDQATFRDYKENYESTVWCKLLYSIAHKLPFLKIKVGVEENFESLLDKSKVDLETFGLWEFKEQLDSKLGAGVFEDLKEWGITDFLELLKQDSNGDKA